MSATIERPWPVDRAVRMPDAGKPERDVALLLKSKCFALVLSAAVVLAQAYALPTSAKEPARHVTMQLNKLQQLTNACRMTFLLMNRMGAEIRDVSFEIVLFDNNQAVARLLALNTGRLPAGKTRVKQFDIKALACGDIGRVLLNDVKRCAGETLTPAVCLDAARPSSRIATPFNK